MSESPDSFLQLRRLEQQLASAQQAANTVESIVGEFTELGDRLAQVVSLYEHSLTLLQQHEQQFSSLLEEAREKLATLERDGAQVLAHAERTVSRLEREHEERWRMAHALVEELVTRIQGLEQNWLELVRHYGESLSSIKADVAQLREYLTMLEGRVGQLEAVNERLAARLERTERGLRRALLMAAGAGIGLGAIGLAIGCLVMVALFGSAAAR
jgi:chromosome segregation ATPase